MRAYLPQRLLLVATVGVCALALGAGAPTLAAPDGADSPATSTIFLPVVKTMPAPTVVFSIAFTYGGPFWPDGYHDIFLLSGAAHQVREVFHHDHYFNPAWSGDGAFLSNQNGLVLHTLEISSTQVYTLPEGIDYSWEPGGNRLVYTAVQTGTVSSTYTLMLSNADGSGAVQLLPSASYNTFAKWSPDGSAILACINAGENGRMDCSVLNADGTLRQSLGHINVSWSSVQPAWNPDGTEIFYTTEDDRRSYLWVQPVDGGPPKQISSPDRSVSGLYPVWSPDSRFIAYVEENDQHDDTLLIVDANGNIYYQSPIYGYGVSELRWLPDSSKIVYLALIYVGNNLKETVWTVNPDGTDLHRIVAIDDMIDYLWVYDNRTLIYRTYHDRSLFSIPIFGGSAPILIAENVPTIFGRDTYDTVLFSQQQEDGYSSITRARLDGTEAEDLAVIYSPDSILRGISAMP